MMTRDSVVFPEPDSPTIARHSPGLSPERGVVHHLMVAVERIDVADNQDRLGFHCRGVGENVGLEVLQAISATRKHATE